MVDIRQTFAGREILVTGANGFVGKVVVAMLLERYPDVARVHLLLRARNDADAAARYEREMLASPAWRRFVPAVGREFLREKIRVWEGDAAEPCCGLAEVTIDAWKLDLIIHCAGMVEFFPPVEDSLRANVETAENVASLAKRCGAKMLHVSTCYVAGQHDGLVEEDEPVAGFYPRRQGAKDDAFDCKRELAELRQNIRSIAGERDRDREMSDQLIELGAVRARRWGWVNTYTYSKSLAEQLLVADPDLALSIVRPAIVESALRYPFPGWVEGGRTAAPLVLMALGGLKQWPARGDLALEIVPVDLVAAGILIASGLLLDGSAELVYQLASADMNPFEMRPLLELLDAEARRRGAPNGGRLRLLDEAQYRRSNRSLKQRAEKMQSRLNALAAWLGRAGLPGAQTASGRASRLRMLELQAGFREQTVEQYLPFILANRYIFEAARIRSAYERISPDDRERLPWDPERIDWPTYWREQQIAGVLEWVQPEAVKDWAFQL